MAAEGGWFGWLEARTREGQRAACPICFDASADFSLRCSHALCRRCTVAYTRSALGDVHSHISGAGIRCPLHASGCDGHLTSTDALELLAPWDARRLARFELTADGRQVLREQHDGIGSLARAIERTLLSPVRNLVASLGGSGSLEHDLTLAELQNFNRFELEAAIPEHERTTCPRCKLLVLLPEPPRRSREVERSHPRRLLAAVREALRPHTPPPHDLHCPHCAHAWNPLAAAGDRGYDERVTALLIRLTSKACPNCKRERVSHFHGHGCHQISPYSDGCVRCHQHFCYVCLRKHGTPGGGYQCGCSHGSSFCAAVGIAEHLILEPYPRDSRCGCPLCNQCAVGRPCDQCDGSCVVCLGLVAPGPTHLSATVVRAALRNERCNVM
jgi:hypothetical protein